MRKFRILLSLALVAVLLANCSYFETEEVVLDTQPPADTIDLGPAVHVEPMDLMEIAGSVSDGSVEVYGFESEAVSVSPSVSTYRPSAVAPLPARSSYRAGPSVEVFPLDDDMAAMLAPNLTAGGVASLMPQPPPAVLAAPLSVPETGQDFVSVTAPGQGSVRVYFEHDSAELDSAGKQALSDMAAGYDGGSLSVEGHASVRSSITDPVKRKIINLKVSMDRAFSVARNLITGGVPPDLVRTVAWGEARPAAATNGKDSESASRRVDIFPLSGQ